MKRLMEEATARHVEAIHHSASTGIHVGVGKATSVDTNPGILLVVLETLSERKVKNKAVDRAERQVHDDTGFIKDQLRRSHGAR